MSTSARGPFIALALLVLIWGYSWIIMKQVMAYAGPFEFAALRYLLGAIVIFVYLLIRRQSIKPPPLVPTLLVGLAQTSAFQGLAQWALVNGGAGKVSLFCYTMPFWVLLLAWWWLQETPRRKQWIGLGFAVLGLFFVIAPWQDLGNGESILLAIGAGIAWAIGTVLSKRTFQRHAVSAVNFTAWQMLFGALVLCFVAWQVPSAPIEWSTMFIAGLAYSALLASSLAWVLWSVIVRSLPTSVAGLSSLLVPICAILFAWALLGETPDLAEFIGIACIMTGLLVIRPRRAKRPVAPRSLGPHE